MGGLAVTICASLTAFWLLANGATIPEWGSVALLIWIVPLFTFFSIRWMYWSTISNGVEVTPRQLPEIHALYAQLLEEMDVPWTPRLYVLNGNGTLNAFASKCQLRRTYVVLYSDLVDVAYEFSDFAGVKFVLAHELGHIKCRHVDLWRVLATGVVALVRLDKSIIRAQEYTADRVASYYAPEGARHIMFLFAGKRIYRHVSMEEYMASVAAHKDGFWLRAANLFADHAVGFRRMSALYQVNEKGWDIHGRML